MLQLSYEIHPLKAYMVEAFSPIQCSEGRLWGGHWIKVLCLNWWHNALMDSSLGDLLGFDKNKKWSLAGRGGSLK